jgi:LmbE family N-acetylglucosaminyl deacetylase
MERFSPDMLARYDCLFIAPHGDDVMLACPARLQSEAERGRQVLVLALFERGRADSRASEAAAMLGVDYATGGLTPVEERRAFDTRQRVDARTREDDDVALDAARMLADAGARTQAVHVYAPLGLAASVDHVIAYEAAVRAFATEQGRNLFLYEERPEAFVPGAVRMRLAMLGARLPPAAQHSAERASLWRHLWRVNEPRVLRGEPIGFAGRLSAVVAARRRFREARPWKPLRALGPRLQPVLHMGDEEAATRARAVAEVLLPRDAKQRPWAALRFNAHAAGAARRLGGVYHAERLWLFLPSNGSLAETQHPLELAQA